MTELNGIVLSRLPVLPLRGLRTIPLSSVIYSFLLARKIVY